MPRCIVCRKKIILPPNSPGNFKYCSEECRLHTVDRRYRAFRISYYTKKIKYHEKQIKMYKKIINDIKKIQIKKLK
jgi:predicted nucleic acid-binding Zn ribbon protein